MANAKEEFLHHIAGRSVACAVVYDYVGEGRIFELPVFYSEEELKRFLTELDFDYDEDYPPYDHYGTIWYTDGTWSERNYNDYNIKWVFVAAPRIPDSLKRI
jgi:hypothetical protein